MKTQVSDIKVETTVKSVFNDFKNDQSNELIDEEILKINVSAENTN